MIRTMIYMGVRLLALMLLLLFALVACGSPAPTASGSAESPPAEPTTPAVPVAALDAGGPGIDQTKLDLCTLIPRAKVEAAIGALVEAPKPSIAIGNEVGCEYVVDQGRAYEITVYNLDRWDLIPQIIDDATATPGLGDGAYSAKSVGGGTELYVLLRDRAVVAARVNGADTPPFRHLLDVALAQVR